MIGNFTKILVCLLLASQLKADVYVIVYATNNGQSGHVGIAIDRYDIKIYDDDSSPNQVRIDTVASGELIYFDFWPLTKHFNKELVLQDIPAKIYRLPRSSAEKKITQRTVKHYHFPHQNGYSPDGILQISIEPKQSMDLLAWLESLKEDQYKFNAIRFNCVDFVNRALEKVLNYHVEAKEDILFIRASTPNKLFLYLSQMESVSIIKDPGEKVKGSFLSEKILKRNQS